MFRQQRPYQPICRPTIALGFVVVALLVSATGCGGPKIPPEDLGEVLQELPKLPEAEKPYEHPELVSDGLDVPAAKSEAESAAAAAAQPDATQSEESSPATPAIDSAETGATESDSSPESNPTEPK